MQTGLSTDSAATTTSGVSFGGASPTTRVVTASEITQADIDEAQTYFASLGGTLFSADMINMAQYQSVDFKKIMAYMFKTHKEKKESDATIPSLESCLQALLAWGVARGGNPTTKGFDKTDPEFVKALRRAAECVGVEFTKASGLPSHVPNIPRLMQVFVAQVSGIYEVQPAWLRIQPVLADGVKMDRAPYVFPGAASLFSATINKAVWKTYLRSQYYFSLQVRSQAEKKKDLTDTAAEEIFQNIVKFTALSIKFSHVPKDVQTAYRKKFANVVDSPFSADQIAANKFQETWIPSSFDNLVGRA